MGARLEPRTGWNSTPVSGFLPAPAFFEMLAARRFPTTTWLRSRESLEYTPEPDVFHDVFGHVPMHAHRVFAGFLEHYGRVCAAIDEFVSKTESRVSQLWLGALYLDILLAVAERADDLLVVDRFLQPPHVGHRAPAHYNLE